MSAAFERMGKALSELDGLEGPTEKKQKLRDGCISQAFQYEKELQAAEAKLEKEIALKDKEIALKDKEIAMEKEIQAAQKETQFAQANLAFQKALDQKETQFSQANLAFQKALDQKDLALAGKELALQAALSDKEKADRRVTDLERDVIGVFRSGGKLTLRALLECELKHLYYKAMQNFNYYTESYPGYSPTDLRSVLGFDERLFAWGLHFSTFRGRGSTLLQEILSFLAENLDADAVETRIADSNLPDQYGCSRDHVQRVMPTLCEVLSRAAHNGMPLELSCLDSRVAIPVADQEFTIHHQLAVATLLKLAGYTVTFQSRAASLVGIISSSA